MFSDFAQRAQLEERMDDLSIQGPELEGALLSLERVNRLLGGHRLILGGLDTLWQHSSPKPKVWKVLDLGCGGGDTLRAIARWGYTRGRKLELVGWDANPNTAAYARERCAGCPSIEIQAADAFADPFPPGVDVVLCSLFLHHFSEDEICSLIRKMHRSGIPFVLINDLHRTPLAYTAFQLFCAFFRIPNMARHDGLISIRKGFRRADWEELIPSISFYSHSLKWQWAFRWQLLLQQAQIRSS
jgi:SAM-dependent methyltransferase